MKHRLRGEAPAGVVLFDDGKGGHHRGFVSGLAQAFSALGREVEVFSHEPPGDGVAWHQVQAAALRSYRTTRRNLLRAAPHHQDRPALFCDLYLDKNLLSLPRSLRNTAHVHVLHRPERFAAEGQTAKGAVRAAWSRVLLRRLLLGGGWVIVHTPRGLDMVSAMATSDRVVRLGLPAASEADLVGQPPRPTPRHDHPHLLFVGGARPDKGLELLLAATGRLGGDVVVDVVGKQPRGLRERLAALDGRHVCWHEGDAAAERLVRSYREASLVVLPYTSAFRRHGGASGVMLEAMAHGVPMVVSDAVAEDLPPGFGGAVVVEADDPEPLAEGLRQALDDLPALSQTAARQGPQCVLADHTYESYVRGLLRLAALSGRDRAASQPTAIRS